MKSKWLGFILFVFLTITSVAYAEDAKLDTGDTAWMIVATALVMMMTPAGLALFYGGMSRYKNHLNTFAMTVVAYCLGSVIWMLWGYALAFGPDKGGFIGGLTNIFLSGIKPDSLSGSIPTFVFVLFQMTFACITIALVVGSIVDRMKFSSWVIFSTLWLTIVYCPVAHWVWGGGFLQKMGALDFAGGNVVHINAGVSALILSIFLGKRLGYGKEPMFPSSISLTALGAGLLWFGWFGFNAGSELKADGIAASAFLVTNTAAATGALSWMAAEWIRTGKPTLLGLASGIVAGLVAITPASGFVNLSGSLVIGLLAGMTGFFSVSNLKKKFKYDDSLDAFGVHGVCGALGAILTGIFADPSINAAGTGLLYGNARQLGIQFISIIVTIVYSGVATILVILITRTLTKGIRVDADSEVEGLDSSLHGERAFEIENS